jgi:putative spermidine/putrescine transport system ATP-binding protein
MSILRLERLSKTYRDGTRALVNVDLQIAQGELITVVGPSGCGKSTLLRLIAGLDTPTGGSVFYQGRDITRLPAERRGMGVVFQNYALFPHMTVAENIDFGLRVRGAPQAQRRRVVEDMLDKLQLTALATRKPDQLSGGQQQRVALGRALAIEPAILLLDEPLTALDAQLREALRVELRRILDRFGITSIYVTHDQAEALSLGDRVIVLHGGRIAQIGTPHTIYQQPASSLVAQFIGISNHLQGIVRRTPDGAYAEAAGAQLIVPLTLNGALADGAHIDLLIRPEDLRLSEPDDAHLNGTISQLQFLGDRLRLFVVVANPSQEFIADVDPHTRISTGATVSLRIVRAVPLYEGA